MDADVTPWWENHVGGSLCQAMMCMERSHFYRYVTINGLEFRQQACIRHAGKENEFCPHCGHYLGGRKFCPVCKHDKEMSPNAD